ncbi:MAG TPA: N,N-dimethylformamidase beta subunit family domain-containing protein, partial [Baekduia sp.]|nr:N,N-dimethylformamidase beta subunit family domain-containing protein [Baekduia sp.]
MNVASNATRVPTIGARPASRWRARAVIQLALLAAGLAAAPGAQAACTPPPGANAIVVENCKDGTPRSDWDVPASGDAGLQGFATDISVNRGSSVQFKIDATTTAYHLDIYRMGYYGGLGARRVATGIAPSNPLNQGACATHSDTGLVDCGNWLVSASWNMPGDAVPGIYFAAVVRNDNSGASHIFFVVRDDGSHSDLYYQTSDTTWQAYNDYGANSLYTGTSTIAPGRAVKVSYNRPFVTGSVDGGQDWVFNAEYPMVRWLERNGYDVSYETGVDTDRAGALLKNHKVFISSGHDEYWSGQQRANVEAARDAGVNLAFFSGNEIFWKTRWEDNHRTLVSYKETHAGAKIDPDPTWTGTWMDARPFNTEGPRPQNALSGTLFSVTAGTYAIQVPAQYGALRFWRNTSIAGLTSGTATLTADTLGYEWDSDVDNGSRPPRLFDVSSATYTAVPGVLQDNGSTYASATATHSMTLYRAPSGALVFGAGTVQWAWGLDAAPPDRTASAEDPRMQQATVNLLADMHAQPQTLQSGVTATTASTDTLPPHSAITSPTTVVPGTPVTIHGTAADDGGGQVAAVEVSLDGGLTWHPATGRENWQYTGTPTSATPMSRAVDDSGNLVAPPGAVTPPPQSTTGSPAAGAGAVQPGSGSGAHGSASSAAAGPRVVVTPRTVRATRAGTVSLRVACPRSAGSCRVALRLELGHRVIATKTLVVTGGKARNFTLKLTRAARRDLLRRRSLR